MWEKVAQGLSHEMELNFLLLQCLNEFRNCLGTVLQELEWDDLTASEWRSLSTIQSLLQPFADFTTHVSG